MADRAVGIPIVREGMPFVAGAAVLTGGAWLAGWTIPTCLFGTLTLFFVYRSFYGMRITAAAGAAEEPSPAAAQ